MRTGAVIAACLAALVILGGSRAAADDIESIMETTHGTNTGLRDKILDAASKDKPDWEVIQKQAKAFVAEINKLPKLTPPNGSKESWEKHTKEYIALTKAFEVAAEKKDAKAIKEAYEKTDKACKGCHDAHR